MKSTIHFYGGAGSVTGANFLLESGNFKFLVDCGLAQGRHNAEADNWEKFAYDPASIPLLIITHAHIDHIGRIPKLVRDGFRGKIISTEVTKAIAGPLLMDSMELLVHDARKHGLQELYNEGHIKEALSLWEGIPYHEKREIGEGFAIEFLDAGHILGSAMVRVTRGDKTMVFTGDLGGGNSPLLGPHEKLGKTDYLLMESVYGDRDRKNDEGHVEQLRAAIENVSNTKGTLLIPAFSTERTQDIIFEIRGLMTEHKVPSMPVYIDSPLAEKITEAYISYPQYFSAEMQKRVENGEKIFSFPELHIVESAETSREISHRAGPKIIIAGSGMSNGGRVHGHEQVVLPDRNSTVLIVGYQAAGSLGRRLVEGDKNVLIMAQRVKVNAKIEVVYGYSAHMDSPQLLEFVSEVADSVKQIFVVMGEPSASGFLAQRIRDYLGLKAIAPGAKDSATIEL
ncbi:MAG: MBL fold metallo-hydrolase [Patescibacteria group bacterium]